jgi:GNAT superfamily N-acetyltransferase
MLAVAVQDGLRSLSLGAGGAAQEVGGTLCWYSSSHVPVYNGAGVFDERLLDRDHLSVVERYFAARQRPYCLVALDGLVPNVSLRLHHLGYWEYEHMPAMLLEGPPAEWEGQSPPRDLQISRIRTRPELLAFRSLLSRVFHIPSSQVDLVISDSTLAIPHVRHYVGWLKRAPVATATLVLTNPLPSIWNVGTLPEHRRHGIGTQIMRHLLAEAMAEGYDLNMLLASPDGLPIYERMGYRTLSTVRVFVPRYSGY